MRPLRLPAIAAGVLAACLLLAGCPKTSGPSIGGGTNAGVTNVGGVLVVSGPAEALSAGSGSGSWVNADGSWAWLPKTIAAGSAGALAGWVAAAAARAAQRKAIHATRGRAMVATIIGNPCWDPNTSKPRKATSTYRISQWIIPGAFGNKVFSGIMRRNTKPFLNCANFYRLISKWGVPTRIAWMYQCIANIILNGTALAVTGDSTYKFRMGWSRSDGWVIADNGVIKDMKPIGGSWRKCAEYAAP